MQLNPNHNTYITEFVLNELAIMNNIGIIKGIVSWNKMTFWQFYCIAVYRYSILKFLKMVFRRFVHVLILFIEKYRYVENRVAKSNYKKSLLTL
jgi:hypothetical protein